MIQIYQYFQKQKQFFARAYNPKNCTNEVEKVSAMQFDRVGMPGKLGNTKYTSLKCEVRAGAEK